MAKETEYLGDGLYASYDGYQICLMANSHTAPTDTVYLDPSVYAALQKFVSRIATEQAEVDAATCPHCGGLNKTHCACNEIGA